MPSIKQALARRGAVAVAAAAGAGAAGAKRRMLNQAPPNKRRRVMLHESSTATEDDDDDDVESSEHDNALDADYRDEENNDERDVRNAHRRRARKSSSSRHSRSYSSASSASASSSSSAASSSLSESSYTSPKPLSPIEVNAGRTSRSASRRRRSSTTKKHKTQAARKLQKGIPVAATAPRFTISPVKLLPSAQSQALRRGFHVRPDAQHVQPYFGKPSDFAMARHHQSAAIVPSPSKNPFRKMAGKFVRAVNNMGISGNARQSGAIPIARQHQHQVQDIYAGPTRPSQVASRAESFNSSTKRKRESARRSTSSTRPAPVELRKQPEDLAAIQPLRRTRSIARKMEEIGAPISGIERGASIDGGSRRSLAEEEEDDDETASVERSIAEMSLDEISEHKEDEDEEEDECVADEDDSWYLNEASSPQLHRLRKDKLLRLASLLPNEAESDHSDYTKDGLVKLILDARLDFKPNESTNPSSSSSGDEDEERTRTNSAADLPTAAQTYATRHTRRASAASDVASTSAPSSSHSTPRKTRRSGLRSKSYPHAVESSAGENEEDEDDVPLAVRRRRTMNHGGHARAVSLNLGKDSLMAERTPGRLRSGKLRASASLSEMPSSSNEEHEEGDEAEKEDENIPTPIARRTRHRRNLSSVSVSSAGLGDDEEGDLANGEYRLRKVSLPRRAKKGSLVEASDSESLEEEEEVEEDIDEAGEETIEAIAKDDLPSDDDDHEEFEDDFNHEEDFDFSTATLSTLMKLKRDDLAKLCRDRDIAEDGTKKDLSNALLEWYSAKQSDNDEIEASSPPTSDNEEDEDFVPQADTSMASVSSVEEDDEEEEAEPDYRNAVSSPARSVRSDATARASTKRARNETKTQALAKLSNKRQSYDAESQEKPILLHSHDDLIHSKKVDTPPGSGDQQGNDLELDLESLNLLDKEIAPDKLKKGEKIGSGGFKDVYEGKYRNVKVALADIRGHLTENDIKELGLLRDLRHENIVRFIGVSIPDQKDVPVTIVTELCSNGDLFDYIRNVSPPPFDKILSIMLNVAKGVDYLHNRKPAIIHRDLKSSNVLITARGVAKIADFGLARVRNSTRSMIKSLVGTVNWQAPELWVAHPRYNEKADVYSAGLVFWECLQWHLSQKRYPFEGMNEHAIYQEVGQKQMRPATATMRRQWGGDILDLVERMWAQDPKERPHMSEVVKDLERLVQVEKARLRAARYS